MDWQELFATADSAATVIVPIALLLAAIWRRIGGVLTKLDRAIETQGTLSTKIDKLETHQQEINGGIIRHMQEDATALGELRAAVAHIEGRLDERPPPRRRAATEH